MHRSFPSDRKALVCRTRYLCVATIPSSIGVHGPRNDIRQQGRRLPQLVHQLRRRETGGVEHNVKAIIQQLLFPMLATRTFKQNPGRRTNPEFPKMDEEPKQRLTLGNIDRDIPDRLYRQNANVASRIPHAQELVPPLRGYHSHHLHFP